VPSHKDLDLQYFLTCLKSLTRVFKVKSALQEAYIYGIVVQSMHKSRRFEVYTNRLFATIL